MKRYKTLEEAQVSLIELLEERGEFRGTFEELSEELSVKPEQIRPLLQILKASGDILFEELDDHIIVKPASFITVPPVLTEEQRKEVEEKVREGYKLIACSTMGGVQSRELRSALGKRVIVYFRNGTRIEAKLKGFDRFCLKLRNYMGNILAYKHAISTIVYKP
ncbi:MAG: Like-Sm ribonucleoprotein core [Thermovibrio sp.]|nr:MAG: Like-Sm ribonucleoprotein core [Thermovibrio sp.]